MRGQGMSMIRIRVPIATAAPPDRGKPVISLAVCLHRTPEPSHRIPVPRVDSGLHQALPGRCIVAAVVLLRPFWAPKYSYITRPPSSRHRFAETSGMCGLGIDAVPAARSDRCVLAEGVFGASRRDPDTPHRRFVYGSSRDGGFQLPAFAQAGLRAERNCRCSNLHL